MTVTDTTTRTDGPIGPHRRRKVYVEGTTAGVRVPFTEVVLGDPLGSGSGTDAAGVPAPVRLYDTSGPLADPRSDACLTARPVAHAARAA